jgi:Domain of unknown function (DUF4262)
VCWQCDNPDKTQADYLDVLRAGIAEHGWVVQYVEDDRMPFAYTIGLHERRLPELVVSGLGAPRAQWLLNTFAKRMLAGRPPVPGNQVWLPAGTRVELVDVARPDVHLVMAVGIEGDAISAIQLVWADGRGRWPWALGFNDGGQPQAVLGVRAC